MWWGLRDVGDKALVGDDKAFVLVGDDKFFSFVSDFVWLKFVNDEGAICDAIGNEKFLNGIALYSLVPWMNGDDGCCW